MSVASDLVEYAETSDSLLKCIIRDDEMCVSGYDPETKEHSFKWKSPFPL
jgi:hypothetical protein